MRTDRLYYHWRRLDKRDIRVHSYDLSIWYSSTTSQLLQSIMYIKKNPLLLGCIKKCKMEYCLKEELRATLLHQLFRELQQRLLLIISSPKK